MTLGIRYLCGEAKREILVLPKTHRETFKQVLEHLENIYGEKVPVTTLMSNFYSRSQFPQESLRTYALALQELVGKINNKFQGQISKPDMTLRDKFVEGLRDPALKLDLKKDIRQNNAITFKDIKDQALFIESEGYQATEASETIQVNQIKRDDIQVLRDDLNKVTKCMEGMRFDITRMQSDLHVGQSQRFPSPSNGNVRPNFSNNQIPPQMRRNGPFNCWHCGQEGHKSRECQNRVQTDWGNRRRESSQRGTLN